jgi:hypothetical protein
VLARIGVFCVRKAAATMRIVVVNRRDVESLFCLPDSMAANACEGENAVLRCLYGHRRAETGRLKISFENNGLRR